MNFDFLVNLPVAAAAQELRDTNAPRWDAFTLRQDLTGSPHVDTKCIPLRGALSFLDSFMPAIERVRYPVCDELPSTMALVNKVLAGLPVDTVGNVMAVALMPGGRITPHFDGGAYAEHFERLHIVLTTKAAWFKCGDTEWIPSPGDVFFFNHRITHSVGNPSSEARVHLIVDLTLKD